MSPIANRGLDRCRPGALASEYIDFQVAHPDADDPFGEVLAFCLATFVGDTPVTPLGYDVSEQFKEVADDGE